MRDEMIRMMRMRITRKRRTMDDEHNDDDNDE